VVCESLGLVCWLMLVGLRALLEAEALPVHLQDMDMVGEEVEESPGEPFRAKDFGPLVEGQVTFFPAFGYNMVVLSSSLVISVVPVPAHIVLASIHLLLGTFFTWQLWTS